MKQSAHEKNIKRSVDGVLLVDKPPHITSNALLQTVKKLFYAKKAGHSGALDPMATGILPICLGQATKFSQFLLNADKRYLAAAQLGQTTNTGDCEGEVLTTADTTHITLEKIRSLLPMFCGKIKQTPPMFSALKQNGIPLYKLARAGKTVVRQARCIEIFKLTLLHYENDLLTYDVHCSKGTYIRTLAEDMGKALGVGASLQSLRRIGFAHYDIKQAYTLDTLKHLAAKGTDALDSTLRNKEDMLNPLKRFDLNAQQSIAIQQGQMIPVNQCSHTLGWVKLFAAGQFIGVGKIVDDVLMPKRLLSEKG